MIKVRLFLAASALLAVACVDQPASQVPSSQAEETTPSLRPEKPFRLLVHCGLSYPLPYRGRFWLPTDPQLRRTHNPPEGFGSDDNYDEGTIQRVDHDTLIYRSSEGVEVEYEPTTRKPKGCE